jgi:hypothetical protein
VNYQNIQEIPVKLVLEHPENSNYMDALTSQKLRHHIECTGRYEPLIVRPHPSEKDLYQVINGHNRLRALKALEHQIANCLVWHIDDTQTRLYLATLNRLSGNDTPERRAMLIENLLGSFSKDELLSLIPENEKQIEALRQLTHIELDESSQKDIIAKHMQVPVIVTFMLEEPEAKELDLALDLIVNTDEGILPRSKALVTLARSYLKQCKSITNSIH